MSSSFICEKCGSTSFDQITYTQARCLQCGYLNLHDSGYKGQREFQLTPENDLLNVEEKIRYISVPIIKRFVNYLIDSMVISFIFIIIIVIAEIDINTMVKDTLRVQLYALPISLIYYTIMEYAFTKTIGKFITKTHIISLDGNKLSFKQCLYRSLCRIIPFEFLSGLLSEGNFWHDTIPNTKLIED